MDHIKQREVELGNGLPDIRSMGQCIEALKQAGFEVSFLSCEPLFLTVLKTFIILFYDQIAHFF